ncbi:MAG: YcaQ family DNA glycosylase [Candidatus Eisenbacteria bacterium]|uniref:YcaQ family DNA glycosylase n=1 Tax=Eiseniibacteriota bacterium TaxID=2212470 RepID=A0A933S9N6_UNCEI|nr:YcaQ family DNA glycosylase [Candidatus Eisenbacteria bacterium]
MTKHAHPTISRRAAAALCLERQHLDRPRARRLTAASLESFVGDVCGLQIDSVNVLDRAHHLTLWSRFGAYDRATLDRLVERRRVLFEYLTHVACFVATRDLPLWRSTMAMVSEGPYPLARWGRAKGNARLIAEVEAAVRERAPIGNADFERPKGEKAGGWWSWKPAMHALDWLWKTGRIGVHSRRSFQKRYAPMDRLLPAPGDAPVMSAPEVWRERVRRSLAAMGAAWDDDLRMYWTWPRRPASWLRDALGSLEREGEVTEVRIEGEPRRAWALTADLPALQGAGRARRPSRGTTLLCPFDSFLWHRERTLRLFGFFYRIEIYVPAPQRRHGYYTLPILHEGHLIGRVDLKHHRADGVLEARHVSFEPWFAAGAAPPVTRWAVPDRDEALAGLAESLHSLAQFTGARSVKVARTTPTAMHAATKRALARAVARATARPDGGPS